MGSDYCNPVLKKNERWNHSPESQLIIDIWDGMPGTTGIEIRPQTVKLFRQKPSFDKD